MQRRNFLKATAAGVAAAPLALSATSAQAAEKVRWRMQRYWGTESDAIHNKFKDNLKEASGGNFRITHFRGGELVPNDQMMDAVSKGIIDCCQGYGGYWPGQLDMAKIEGGLPGAWTNYDEAIYAWDKGLLEHTRAAYAEKNIHYVQAILGGPYDLLTKEPITSLDDLKKMKIRATSTVAAVLEQFDIPTVYLPTQELYVALSTGAIDGVIYGGPMEYKELKLNEVATHYTYLNMLNPGYCDNVLVNMDKWKALTEEQQRDFELSVNQLAADQHGWISNASIDVGGEGLFTFNTLSETDSKRMAEASANVWKDEAAKSPRNAAAIATLTSTAKATGRM